MERAALLTQEELIRAENLGLVRTDEHGSDGTPAELPSLSGVLEGLERTEVQRALRDARGNISLAAARLGVKRTTLRYRIRKLGLESELTPRSSPRRPTKPMQAERTGRPAPDADVEPTPRYVALLRVDIRADFGGSAESIGRRGPDLGRWAQKLEHFGGRILEHTSGAMTGVFGVDWAEDAPLRAALAGLTVLKSAERESGVASSVRVPLHVAALSAGERMDGLQPLLHNALHDNRAALEALSRNATPGFVLVSSTAARFISGRFRLKPVDAGTEPHEGYRLSILNPVRPTLAVGSQSRFVGRTPELRLLLEALAQAREGHGRAVGIIGEPGVGKSRLLYEFRELALAQGAPFLESRCHSWRGDVAYLPIIDLVREACQIGEGSDADSALARVRATLSCLGARPDQHEPYLALLLRFTNYARSTEVLSPPTVRARIFEASRAVLRARTLQDPVIVAVEDLHWIDDSSREFLDSLVDELQSLPLLFLATYRSPVTPPWLGRSHVSQLALRPLSAEESLDLVRAVLAPSAVAATLETEIVTRGEGNPFFLEELGRMAVQDVDRWRAGTIPPTVELALSSRLARLPARQRRLLQTASVLGREFSRHVLEAIVTDRADISDQIRALVRLDFLRETRTAAEPRVTFKHALTHESVTTAWTLPIG